MKHDDANAASTIESEIAQWRSTIRGLSAAELDELTDHVASAAHALAARGLSPGESVLIASRRLGASTELEREFTRAHGHWRLEGDAVGLLMLGAAAALLAKSALAVVPRVTGLVINAIPLLSYEWANVALTASVLVPLVTIFSLMRARTASPLLAWLQQHPWRTVAVAMAALIAPSVVSLLAAHYIQFPSDPVMLASVESPSLVLLTTWGVRFLVPIALIVLALRRSKHRAQGLESLID